MRGVAILLLCAGCDDLFNIEHIDLPKHDASGESDSMSGDGGGGSCPRGYRSPGDFDGDGRANDVDVCPDMADLGLDSDGDGVGDDCDPHPASRIDCILLFDSFQTLDCWTASGTWTACGGPGGACVGQSGGFLRLEPSMFTTTGAIRGVMGMATTAGPTITLVLNDTSTTTNVPIVGTGCQVTNQGGNYATTVSQWADNGAVTSNSIVDMPLRLAKGNAPLLLLWLPNTTSTTCATAVEDAGGTTTGSYMSGAAVPGNRTVIAASDVPFTLQSYTAYSTSCE